MSWSCMQGQLSVTLPAVLGGSQTLVEVVHQEGEGEGVGAGLVAGARLGGHSALPPGLLLVLQVLVRPLRKDAHHLPMHLPHTQGIL